MNQYSASWGNLQHDGSQDGHRFICIFDLGGHGLERKLSATVSITFLDTTRWQASRLGGSHNYGASTVNAF